MHREGDDVTVVAIGHLVHDALAVADELADEVSVEVFDPRTVYPFDWDGLIASVRKTGRLVVVDDSQPLLRRGRRDPGHAWRSRSRSPPRPRG